MLIRLLSSLASLGLASPIFAAAVRLTGTVVDVHGRAVPGASVKVGSARITTADAHGQFRAVVRQAGRYVVVVSAPSFQTATTTVDLPEPGTEPRTEPGPELQVRLTPGLSTEASVVVTADVNVLDVLSPDPAEKVFVKQDLLDANPGRPGAPVSVPGYPIETASSGIKAPQYFAPGVAGDHGEPIAQFLAVGGYLLPNNLSANAHGNGYADPNLLIPTVIETVQVDGGAFNVRQGNHAVNVAATYGLRSRLDPFLTLTGDTRDLDLTGGFSPGTTSFVAFELSAGNGFLARLEHRQQYKINAQRTFTPGNHRITMLGIGYWGKSYIPGLAPLFPNDTGDPGVVNFGDTIDPRQRDQTHTALVAASDTWTLTGSQQLLVSGFFRTYNLTLLSNFGGGLIRQSEFRTVAGQSTNYVNKLSEAITLLAGVDYQREAPRRDNLDNFGDYTGSPADGPFQKVDSSDVTITSSTPYGAASGALGGHVRYYAGWRRDEIDITDADRLNPANSFQKWVGVNSPKATVSFLPGDWAWAPLLSGSFGEAFFTDDPRIGIGSGTGTSVARSHAYQLVASKTLLGADLKLTLGHVTTSDVLAKLDPDTGLQQDQGPGRLRFLTAAVRRNFTGGSLLLTYSKADARDLDSGQPTPEAPRTLFDLLASVQRLPLGLEARGEFELVGRKTLGTGCLPNPAAQCLGTQVRELRGAVVKPFRDDRLQVGVNFLVASGHTGQTLESFGDSSNSERVGVRIPTYASLNLTYRFNRR